MTYQRDPLSVRYDRTAAAMIRLSIEQFEKRAANRRLVGYVRFRVDNPRAGVVREPDDRALSRHERALQRALYYDPRIYQLSGGRPKPAARWSLRLDWEAVPVLPGRPRYVRVQVFGDLGGRLHAELLPDAERWTANEGLRSTPDSRPGGNW